MDKKIMQFLHKNGEQFDSDIAEGTGLLLEVVRSEASKLLAQGQVTMCRATRVIEGRKIEGTLYRAANYRTQLKFGKKQARFNGSVTER